MDSNSLTWFLMEARRRQLISVLAIYVVGAWVVLQVAATLFPGWHIPQQAIRYVWIGAVMLFPVVLVLGWYYDLSAQGFRRTSPADAETKRQGLTRQDYGVLSLIALFSAGILFGVVREVLDTRELRLPQVAVAENPRNSIAVLPFLNLSDIAEQEHFADGLTEELLNSLAATDGLRVISRTSSFAFKGRSLPTKEVAAQLNVAYILEGSVRRTGNIIRVTAQLIDAESDSHLWSRNYDDIIGTDNLFKVQENIASLVTDSVQPRLKPQNMPKAPASIETLDLYYDGLAIFRELQNGLDISDEKFSRAAAKFEAALQAEPDWLPAFLKLGQLYHWWSFGSDKEKLQTSRRYMTEVLRRDPQNASAHWSMGYILFAEGDFEGSLDAYDTGEQSGGLQGWGRGITLAALGRFDEAVVAYQRAVPIFPISLALKFQLTSVTYCAGQYSSIVSDEDDLIATWTQDKESIKYLLAYSHARLGNNEKALAYVDELVQLWQTEAYFADLLAIVGEPERARRAIDELVERDQGFESAATAALILGERDTALDLLERHLEKQSSAGATRFLFCAPEIRALAGNARYDAMLESRGLLGD